MKFLRNFAILLLLIIVTAVYFLFRYERLTGEREAYLVPSQEGVLIFPIISAGMSAPGGYRMAGVPDGLGAFNNGDETFTVLMHHEISESSGKVHMHGNTGAFISRWVITKPGHPDGAWKIQSGKDAIQKLRLWNPSNNAYMTSTGERLGRLCSADMPKAFAFSYELEGLGTTERLFLGGEENDKYKVGRYGRAFATIATGHNRGETYELPLMGDMSFENVVASPYAQKKTVVAALDDSVSITQDTLGEVYFYAGEKTSKGTDIEKAGLTNGILYGLSVHGLNVENVDNGLGGKTSARFDLVNLGDFSSDNGEKLFGLTKAYNPDGITKFLRPEDGAWHPVNPGIFYFTTTGATYTINEKSVQKFKGPGRLWELIFDDISQPEKGGVISIRLDGTEGVVNPDNITVAGKNHILIQEDPGKNERLAKLWIYHTGSLKLVEIAQANPKYFNASSRKYITKNEESSGIIDISDIVGEGWYLATIQSHLGFRKWYHFFNRFRFGLSGKDGQEIVEDGQLVAIYVPPGITSR